MVLAYVTLVFHRKTKVLYWSSLVLVTRVFVFILAILGSHLFFHCFLLISSLAPSGEGGGSSQDKAQALRSSKQLQNDSFSKLFVRVSRGGIGERSSCIWAPGYSSSSLWPTLETVARAAQKCPRRPRAPKRCKTIAFQCLLSGFSGANLWAALGLSFLCSPHTRNEEDIVVPGLLLEHHFLVLSPLTRVMRRT